MLRINPEFGGAEIAVVGDFNPAVFSPKWFAANGLIRETAAEHADLEMIHPEVADFTADWVRIQVTRNMFVAASVQAPFIRLRDLVHGVFHDFLFHTPLRGFGINYSVHFLVDSLELRDRMGATLVPLEPWGCWRERLNLDGRYGGMTSVRVSQLRPADRDQGGQINIVVESSNRVGTRRGTGVFASVNDHFDGDGNAERLMATLASEFEASLDRSEQIVNHIMSLAQSGG